MRDLRDPQRLGEELLRLKVKNRNLSTTYDAYRSILRRVPNYPQDESMAKVASRQYRKENEEKAAAGDRYAQHVLDCLNEGRPVEVDEPSS